MFEYTWQEHSKEFAFRVHDHSTSDENSFFFRKFVQSWVFEADSPAFLTDSIISVFFFCLDGRSCNVNSDARLREKHGETPLLTKDDRNNVFSIPKTVALFSSCFILFLTKWEIHIQERIQGLLFGNWKILYHNLH